MTVGTTGFPFAIRAPRGRELGPGAGGPGAVEGLWPRAAQAKTRKVSARGYSAQRPSLRGSLIRRSGFARTATFSRGEKVGRRLPLVASPCVRKPPCGGLRAEASAKAGGPRLERPQRSSASREDR